MSKKQITTILASILAASAFGGSYSYNDVTSSTIWGFDQIEAKIATDYSEPTFKFDDTVDLSINITKSDGDNWYGQLTSTSTTLKSLTVTGTLSRFNLKADSDKVFKIVENLKVTSTAQWGSMFIPTSTGLIGAGYEIGGSFISESSSTGGFCAGHASWGAINYLKVAGDMTGNFSQIKIGKAQANYNPDRWATADLSVGGLFSSNTNTSFYYTNSSFDNGNFYYTFGAINQSKNFIFENRVANAASFSKANIMINGSAALNGGSAIMSGSITEQNDDKGINAPSVKIFMNSSDGEFVQSFTGTSLGFTGGVTVQSGKLLMNFSETSGVNHGDLTMQGGRFSNAGGYSSFLLSNVVFNGGTIALLLDSATAMDTLNLSGTVKLLDGAAADSKLTFYFGTNLAWLVNAENDGAKVISWAEKSGLNEDLSFVANEYVDGEGNRFVADFLSKDDGLYVKYVAVPEPATFAAIFGAAALAFAAYRRRK